MLEYPTDWDFYITFRDDKLASVMVNLALRELVPIAELPECMTIRVPLRSPNEQGLCTAGERPQLDTIEDALRDELACDGDRLFAGRRIVDGRFELVFFGAEGSAADAAVDRVMSRFAGYSADSQMTPDPEWRLYVEDLFPSPVELRQILNQRVLRRLEAHGDDLSRPRPVRHWIDFENALARADFVAAIDGREFAVEESDAEGDHDPRPFRLRLERSDAVDHSSINELTIELMLLAEQYQGTYDGWETEVVR